MRTTRVWFISELYYPELTSTGYYITQLAEGLARWFPVRVLTTQPTYASRGQTAPWHESRHGVEISRFRATRFDKNVLLLRLVNAATITMTLGFRAFTRLRQGDVVMVVSNPPTLPPLVLLGCRLRGARCVLLIHDVYPDSVVKAGILAERGVVTRMWRALSRAVLRAAGGIAVLGRDAQELVEQCRGPSGPPVALARLWAETEMVRPMRLESTRLCKELGLHGKFVIQCSGNLGRTHQFEDVLGCAAHLQGRKDIHFVFIGAGARFSQLCQTAKSLNNVTVLPERRRDEISDSLNCCSLAIIPMKAGMKGVSVPSRIYNILASGKPLLAIGDEDSEAALIIGEERIGWNVAAGQPEEIASIIAWAVEHQSEVVEMGTRARAAAEQRFQFDTSLSAYRDLAERLLSTP